MDWNNFLGNSKKVCRSRYSKGKACSVCKKPITNNNESGLCQYCKSHRLEGKHTGESEEHLLLKQKALEFLKGLGCIRLRAEHSMQVTKGRFICDVTGIKDSQLYVVECGGSQLRKLELVAGVSKNIYIWPKGHGKPYQWNSGVKPCSFCGNRISRS